MKRRYKAGDWFRVALDAGTDALGVITHACRSRLFGYFFAAQAGAVYTPRELKALRPQDACARMLFGGAPLEELRWPLVAASLPLDASVWPFPDFGVRGAFGRSWARRTLDPSSMQLVEQYRTDAAAVKGLPAAHFASGREVEDTLRELVCGMPPRTPGVICELRAPIDAASLAVLESGGRAQAAQPLNREDVRSLATALTGPRTELRLHGMQTTPFDLRVLSEWPGLRSLCVDTANIHNPQCLAELPSLQRLRLCAGEATKLSGMPAMGRLRALEIHGQTDLSILEQYRSLEELTLVNCATFDASRLGRLPLVSLTLAHGNYDLSRIRELRFVQHLELRGMPLAELPDLEGATSLRSIALSGVRLLRDLRPLASASALHMLAIEAMPQLRVTDFEPLAALKNLTRFDVDLGNRKLDREIYRLVLDRRAR